MRSERTSGAIGHTLGEGDVVIDPLAWCGLVVCLFAYGVSAGSARQRIYAARNAWPPGTIGVDETGDAIGGPDLSQGVAHDLETSSRRADPAVFEKEKEMLKRFALMAVIVGAFIALPAKASLYHDCWWSQWWGNVHNTESSDQINGSPLCVNYDLAGNTGGEGHCSRGFTTSGGWAWRGDIDCTSSTSCTVHGWFVCDGIKKAYQITCDGSANSVVRANVTIRDASCWIVDANGYSVGDSTCYCNGDGSGGVTCFSSGTGVSY